MMDPSERKRFNQALPDLVQQVDPEEILPYLSCLSQMARQQIRNRRIQDSTQGAMMTLHDHLGRRAEGFQQFVLGLREINLDSLADRLESGIHQDDTTKKTVLTPKPSEPKQNTAGGHTTLIRDKKTGVGNNPSVPKQNAAVEDGTYVRDLNAGVRRILKHLDYSGEQKWQELAGHLGFSYSECKKIENDAAINKESPTLVLINQCTDITLGQLLSILRYSMERIDVADMLEKFTGYKLPIIEDEERADDEPSKDEREYPMNGEINRHRIVSEDKSNNKSPRVSSEVIYERKSGQGHTGKSDMNGGPLQENTHGPTEGNLAAGYCQTKSYNPVNLPKPVMKRQVYNVDGRDLSIDGDKLFESEELTKGNIMPNRSNSSSQNNTQVPSYPYKQNGLGVSMDKGNLVACERSTVSACTETIEEMMVVPVVGGEPTLVKRVQFHQQDSELPGRYVPITAGTPVIQSQHKVFPGLIAQPQDTLVDNPDVVPDGSESMLISVGEAFSVHHHDTQHTLDKFPSTDDEERFSSNEERTEIQRKAFKSLPKSMDIGETTGIGSLDKDETEGSFEDEVDNDYKKGYRYDNDIITDTSNLDSYEISNSIPMSDCSRESNPSVHLICQPGSELYNRRKLNNFEPSSTVTGSENKYQADNLYCQEQEAASKLTVVKSQDAYDQQSVALQHANNGANTHGAEKTCAESQTVQGAPNKLTVVRGEISLDKDSVALHEASHEVNTLEDGSALNEIRSPALVRGEVALDHDSASEGGAFNEGLGDNTSTGRSESLPWRSMLVGTAAAAAAASFVFRSWKS